MGVAESWRTNSSRYLLEGRHCGKCKKYFFPVRSHCSDCMSDELTTHRFSGRGKIVEYTRIEESAQGFEELVPYYYGIIELEEGVKISAQIVAKSEDEIDVGTEIEMTFRKLFKSSDAAIINYGFKAEPLF